MKVLRFIGSLLFWCFLMVLTGGGTLKIGMWLFPSIGWLGILVAAAYAVFMLLACSHMTFSFEWQDMLGERFLWNKNNKNNTPWWKRKDFRDLMRSVFWAVVSVLLCFFFALAYSATCVIVMFIFGWDGSKPLGNTMSLITLIVFLASTASSIITVRNLRGLSKKMPHVQIIEG